MAKFREIFRGKSKYVKIRQETDAGEAKKEVPDGLWTKCPECRTLLYNKDLERNFNVCDKCGYHFVVSAATRLAQLLDDPESFVEIDANLVSANPLDFPHYPEKLQRDKEKTGENDAIVTGIGRIGGVETVIGVMEFSFMGGSMGSVVGERLTRAFEKAIELSLPVVTLAASGGARMQEGILSLMQMQKTAAAVWEHGRHGLLYISVLTHPTLAGVFGSFASLGDVIIAEPGATIGFAGQRVIEETIRKAVPPNLQKAETVFENGFIDMIVPRTELKNEISRLLLWHTAKSPITVDRASDKKQSFTDENAQPTDENTRSTDEDVQSTDDHGRFEDGDPAGGQKTEAVTQSSYGSNGFHGANVS